MEIYEYKIIVLDNEICTAQQVEIILNEKSEEGWEFVASLIGDLIFKRLKKEGIKI